MALSNLYRSLARESNEFRLLHIAPGSPSTPIKCTLQTLSLGQYSRHKEGIYDWTNGKTYDADWEPDGAHTPVCWVPPYEALSYTWGNKEASEEIMVNGQIMKITANLKAALLALRKHDEERTMWIDALSINQEDVQERNVQVPRIPTIYQRAFRTIAWLGDADETALQAMDVLESLGGTKAHMDTLELPEPMIWCGPQYDYGYGVGQEVEKAVFQEKLEHSEKQPLIDLPDLSERDWEALQSFIDRRPYWRRLWIIQEIANSREVIFQCGSRRMGIETFEYFLPHLRSLKEKKQPLPTGELSYAALYEKFKTIIEIPLSLVGQRQQARRWTRSFGFENHATSLLNVLEQFRGFQCTDPRDRVYALLGLPSLDRNMPLPKPDYTKSVAQVYCETAKAIIRHTADLTILCVPGRLGESMLKHQLPSWVPEWASKKCEQALFWSPDELPSENSAIFAAAGDTLPDGPEFKFPPDETGKQRKKSRPTMHRENRMILVTGGLQRNGLIEHPTYEETTNADFRLLELNGYLVDCLGDFSDFSNVIPESAFADNTWKQHIVEWEKMIRAFKVFGQWGDEIREIDPGLRHPHIYGFVQAIFKGKLFRRREHATGDLMKIYVEHYLVWTQRITPSEARVPIDPDLLELSFDGALKRSVRGWKFAVTRAHRLALVPSTASHKDAIVILFGGDCPLLLRPFCKMPHEGELKVCWMLTGTAFVSGLMGGEVLDMAGKKGLVKESFLLM